MAHRLQYRRDTKANWLKYNPVLMEGEVGYETDTHHQKVGNGVSTYSELEYEIGVGNITQEMGDSESLVMSQKAVSEIGKQASTIGVDITAQSNIINRGAFINANGTMTSGEIHRISDTIALNKGDVINLITSTTLSTNTNMIWLSETDDNITSTDTRKLVGVGEKINEEDGIVCIEYVAVDDCYIIVQTAYEDCKLYRKASDIGKNINILNVQVNSGDIPISVGYAKRGYYINNRGVIASGDNHYLSNTIKLDFGDTIIFKASTTLSSSTNMIWLSEIADNITSNDGRKLVGVGVKITSANGVTEISYTAINTCYVVLQSSTLQSVVKMTKSLNDKINDVDIKIDNVADSIEGGSEILYNIGFSKRGYYINSKGVIASGTSHYLSDTLHLNIGDIIVFSASTALSTSTNMIWLSETADNITSADGRELVGVGEKINNSMGSTMLSYKATSSCYVILQSSVVPESISIQSSGVVQRINELSEYVAKVEDDIRGELSAIVYDIKSRAGIAYQSTAKSAARPLKILGIGNSWTRNPTTYLGEILNSIGIDCKIVLCYMGGRTLQDYSNLVSNDNANTYRDVWTKENGWIRGNEDDTKLYRMSEIIGMEDWDIVTLQQASQYGGMYDTFQPYLNNIIKWIKDSVNVMPTIYLQATWAYPNGYSGNNLTIFNDSYSGSSDIMYAKILEAYTLASEETKIKDIFLSAPMVQQIRTISGIDKIDTADGSHLDINGWYSLGLLWAHTLLREYMDSSLFGNISIDDVDYKPTAITLTDEQIAEIKDIAIEVVSNSSSYI